MEKDTIFDTLIIVLGYLTFILMAAAIIIGAITGLICFFE